MSLSPTTGIVQAGTGGVLTATLTTNIVGHTYVADYPSATVGGNPAGVSVSFNPIGWYSGPPTQPFTMTITVGPNVPAGTYPIAVDVTLLPGDDDCSGACVQPVYTLQVDPPGTPGITVQLPLQDSVNVNDVNSPPATAPLTDGVLVSDSIVKPVNATLSDIVNVEDTYVAPAVAALTDVVKAVDGYVAPVTAPLSDGVSVVDRLAKASPQSAVALTGMGLLGVGLVALVLLRKRPDNEN